MARMLARAGARRVFVPAKGRSRRCCCRECFIEPSKKAQRAREARQWRREAHV